MVERTTVEICDPFYTPLGLLRDWDSLEFVDRFCDVGSGKVDAVASDFNRELVSFGHTVQVKRDGVVESAGPLVFGEDRSSTVVLKVDWKNTLTYLDRRLVLPAPQVQMNMEPGVLSAADDPRSGRTSSVIRGFVDANCGPSALPYRRAPGLVMGPDLGAGAYLSAAVLGRFDNLLVLCRQLAMSGGVGFGVDTDDRQHTFNVYAVRDLADEVVFSQETHNVAESNFQVTGPTATRFYAGGKGDGIDREYAMVMTADSLADEAVWGLVEAFYSDQSSDGESFTAAASRELGLRGASIAASFTPAGSTLVYGEDYLLGDLVTCVLRPGLSVVKPIREVTRKVSVSGGRTVVPIAGDYAANSGTTAQFQTRELIRVVNALSRQR